VHILYTAQNALFLSEPFCAVLSHIHRANRLFSYLLRYPSFLSAYLIHCAKRSFSIGAILRSFVAYTPRKQTSFVFTALSEFFECISYTPRKQTSFVFTALSEFFECISYTPRKTLLQSLIFYFKLNISEVKNYGNYDIKTGFGNAL